MLKQASRFAAVGLEMGIAVIIGIWLGQTLDTVYGTTPVFFWVCLSIGFGAAAKAVFDAYNRAKKTMKDDGPTDSTKS